MTFEVPSNPKHSVTHDWHWLGGTPSGPTASCAVASQKRLPLTCSTSTTKKCLPLSEASCSTQGLEELGTGLENEDQSKNAVLSLVRSGLLCPHFPQLPFQHWCLCRSLFHCPSHLWTPGRVSNTPDS